MEKKFHSIRIFLLLSPLITQAQSGHSLSGLKNGKFHKDSSFVYTLPFESGKKVFLIQGYESMFSHRGERALDFKVRIGTTVCAARGGVVIAMREDSDRHGLKHKNLADGNYIFIRHADGSEANYWHFRKDGVLVSLGDTVMTGQPIGLSGNTGFSAFPHLHFEVRGIDPVTGKRIQLATRFATRHGILYLRPGRFYRTVYDF